MKTWRSYGDLSRIPGVRVPQVGNRWVGEPKPALPYQQRYKNEFEKAANLSEKEKEKRRDWIKEVTLSNPENNHAIS